MPEAMHMQLSHKLILSTYSVHAVMTELVTWQQNALPLVQKVGNYECVRVY